MRRVNVVGRLLWLTTVSATLSLALAGVGRTQSIADIVERVKPSVAFVLATTDAARSSGTAFVVSADGLLITALHVVEAAREISVTFAGGPAVSASVVAADENTDLAVLRVPSTGLGPLQLATSQATRQGEEVLVVGYPLTPILGSYDVTVTRGIVSAIRADVGLIQVDAAMNPGVSGGPVLNLQGAVVGVAVSGLRARQQVNFAVPASVVQRLVGPLSNQSIQELPAMRIPFLSTQETPLSLQKGFPASSSGTELGAQCLPPPARARVVSGVRGSLRIGDVLAVVWLSLGRGVEASHPGAFAGLGADGAWFPPRIPTRTQVVARSLDYPPEPVCVNYSYQASLLICLSCRFEVAYVIEYRILSVPRP